MEKIYDSDKITEKIYDFDTIVERRKTMSLKYDSVSGEVLPLWVADMDFKTAPEICARIKERADHGIFGYTSMDEDYIKAFQGWYDRHFKWRTGAEWLVTTPGVVFALSVAVRAFTVPGDAVLIQKPVYRPFHSVILDNGRTLINSPLTLINGHYEIDFRDFEEKIINHRVRLFILCSPHNPTGRVWREWELKKIAEICIAHGVYIVSDEIHSDFIYPGADHKVLAALSEKYQKWVITCTSPSKTFNLAGLQISNIIIPDAENRQRFKKAMTKTGYGNANIMGLTACRAAYESGEPWLMQCKAYLLDNLRYIRDYLRNKLHRINLIEPEGTYLIWLDFRQMHLSEAGLDELLINKARLRLEPGTLFGEEGAGFRRMNIACPRTVLRRAMEQLEYAVSDEFSR